MESFHLPLAVEKPGDSETSLQVRDYIGLADISCFVKQTSPTQDTNLQEIDLCLGLGLCPGKEAEDIKFSRGSDVMSYSDARGSSVVEDKVFLSHWGIASRPVMGPGTSSKTGGMKRACDIGSKDVMAAPVASSSNVKNGDFASKNVLKQQAPCPPALWIPSQSLSPAPWHVRSPITPNKTEVPKQDARSNGPQPSESPPAKYDHLSNQFFSSAIGLVDQGEHGKAPNIACLSERCPQRVFEGNINGFGSMRVTMSRVVGWPPVAAYRKQQFVVKPSELFVKVTMDGIAVGRKVDLNAHNTYEGLFQALEQMFQPSSTAQPVGRDCNAGEREFWLRNNSEFELAYEDKEADWMLVGDVPWSLFVGTVRRLRIARKSGPKDSRRVENR